MDSLSKPVELNRETSQMLDEVRSGADNALYGASPAVAEEKIQTCVLPLVEGSGLLKLQVVHYRWYLRELARLWRTRKGSDLAFHLELCIRKWVGLGLEPRTLQFLACETHCRLKGKSEVQSANDECRTESAESAKSVDRTPGLTSASSAVACPSPESEQSAESAKSADVRGLETAKSATSEHSIPLSLDPSIPGSSHSIPRSLDLSIPSLSPHRWTR
jgi:hypothetical protein